MNRIASFSLVLLSATSALAQEQITVEGVLHRTGKVLVGERVYRVLGARGEAWARYHRRAVRLKGVALKGAIRRTDGLAEQRLAAREVELLKDPPPHMARLEGLVGYALSDRERVWIIRLERALTSDGGLTRAEIEARARALHALWENEQWRLLGALEERGGVFLALSRAFLRPPRNRKEREARKADPPPPFDYERYAAYGGSLVEPKAKPESESKPKPKPKSKPKPKPKPARSGARGALERNQS